ncbi:ArdC family protein [Algoriphagus terrigena]|uniref:ArdC family protein n=1 Tax=Algoriphagus terrigena TaxID=344884 RepID=UPI00040D852B|nr:zincin-like metallopeptidase domain-containing protein [Algoriphagus terrigena]
MKTQVKKASKGKRASRAQTKESVADIYGRFTELIIEKLEEGVIPWRQPWHDMGLPANYLTKKPYKGINLWVLLSLRYEYPFYLTYKQAQELGGQIRKGAKSIPICYWNFTYRDKETGKTVPDSQVGHYPLDKLRRSGFLKEFRVFPIEQIDGIKWELPDATKTNELPVLGRCESIYADMLNPPKLIHRGTEAFYRTDLDQITMPEKRLFRTSEEYFGVFFHELVHASGHEDRLGRVGITTPQRFGSENYSREELVAEMGAGYLNNLTGILNDQLLENSAGYIRYWLEQLRNDSHLIIEAAGNAQKAVDYILMKCPF